jgi:hypothetical protein
MEEGDLLRGICGDEDFAQRVKSEREQQADATVVFRCNRMQTTHKTTPVLTISATAKAKSASKVHSLFRCVAACAASLVLRLSDFVAIVHR